MSKENKNCDKCLKELEFKKDCEIKAITLQATNCVQDIDRKLKTKIADLEAKLAELNKEPLNCSQLENGMSLCVIQKSEIAELKQQLAEKDKTIENLRIDLKDYQDLEEKISTKYDKVVEKLAQAEQYKIEFAVEQLEKVKDHYRKFKNTNMGIIKRADIVLFIDNQIEELKKGSE